MNLDRFWGLFDKLLVGIFVRFTTSVYCLFPLLALDEKHPLKLEHLFPIFLLYNIGQTVSNCLFGLFRLYIRAFHIAQYIIATLGWLTLLISSVWWENDIWACFVLSISLGLACNLAASIALMMEGQPEEAVASRTTSFKSAVQLGNLLIWTLPIVFQKFGLIVLVTLVAGVSLLATIAMILRYTIGPDEWRLSLDTFEAAKLEEQKNAGRCISKGESKPGSTLRELSSTSEAESEELPRIVRPPPVIIRVRSASIVEDPELPDSEDKTSSSKASENQGGGEDKLSSSSDLDNNLKPSAFLKATKKQRVGRHRPAQRSISKSWRFEAIGILYAEAAIAQTVTKNSTKTVKPPARPAHRGTATDRTPPQGHLLAPTLLSSRAERSYCATPSTGQSRRQSFTTAGPREGPGQAPLPLFNSLRFGSGHSVDLREPLDVAFNDGEASPKPCLEEFEKFMLPTICESDMKHSAVARAITKLESHKSPEPTETLTRQDSIHTPLVWTWSKIAYVFLVFWFNFINEGYFVGVMTVMSKVFHTTEAMIGVLGIVSQILTIVSINGLHIVANDSWIKRYPTAMNIALPIIGVSLAALFFPTDDGNFMVAAFGAIIGETAIWLVNTLANLLSPQIVDDVSQLVHFNGILMLAGTLGFSCGCFWPLLLAQNIELFMLAMFGGSLSLFLLPVVATLAARRDASVVENPRKIRPPCRKESPRRSDRGRSRLSSISSNGLAHKKLKFLCSMQTAEGRRMLREVRAPNAKMAGNIYEKTMFDAYRVQTHPTCCGLCTLAIVLESKNQVGTEEEEIYSWASQFSKRALKPLEEIHKEGLTLEQCRDVAEALPEVKSATLMHGSDLTLDEFDETVREALRHPDKRVVYNYYKPSLGQPNAHLRDIFKPTKGGGHLSPISAFHARSKMLYIADVAFTTNPVWATVEQAYLAMQGNDETSKKSRGIIVIELADVIE